MALGTDENTSMQSLTVYCCSQVRESASIIFLFVVQRHSFAFKEHSSLIRLPICHVIFFYVSERVPARQSRIC